MLSDEMYFLISYPITTISLLVFVTYFILFNRFWYATAEHFL